jgi:biotin carboxylase
VSPTAEPLELPAVAVLVEPGAPQVFAIASAARGVCRLVWACDLADPAMAAEQRAYARFGTVVDLHGRRGADVATELTGLGVRGVLSVTDGPLPYAAALADHMGLPFHDPATARLCTDKAAQRACLATHGVPSAAFVSVPLGSPLPQGFPVPAVVKPRRGAASRGVVYADDEAAVRAAVAAAGEDVLVEEFLPDLTPRATQTNRADLVAVEMVVRSGEPSLVAVTQRWPLEPPWRETGSCLPAGLPDDVTAEIAAVAFAAAEALGVRHGFLHVEVKRTPTGPRIVEVNGRLGGMVSQLHQLAGGHDLIRQSLLLALDEPLEQSPPLDRVGYLHWLYAPSGVAAVGAVTGLDQVRALPGVTDVRLDTPLGAPIDPSRGNDSHVVAVEGSAPDHATAFALRAGILRAITMVAAV